MWATSLRAKLLWAMVGTVLLVLLAVLIYSQRINRLAFENFLARELPGVIGDPPDLGRFHDRLLRHWQTHESWTGVQLVVREIEQELGERYQLVFMEGPGSGGVALHDDPAENHLFILKETIQGNGLEKEDRRIVRFEPTELSVVGPGGRPLARLTAIPKLSATGEEMESRFLSGTLRWLVGGVVVVGLLGVLLIVFLSGRIVRPIEALTLAARRVEAGDLQLRTASGSRDEIGALSRAFDGMAASLRRLDRLRSNMVGDVAHELRTPLTNVRCQLEALQDGLLESNQDVLGSLHEEIMHLTRLCDDLQEISLAEAGELQLYPEALDVEREVERCVATVPAPDRVRIDLQSDLEVHADPTRFRQVLTNLLTNAFSHTPAAAKVVVSARGVPGAIELSVNDRGPGLAAAEHENVFERFYRADPSRSRSSGGRGCGLGLAIVKHLVEAHGGKVGVESEVGVGARFWFRLPARDRGEPSS